MKLFKIVNVSFGLSAGVKWPASLTNTNAKLPYFLIHPEVVYTLFQGYFVALCQ